MTKNKLLKILTIIGIIFVVLFVGFASLGFYRMNEKNKTAETIERINSTKVTLDDVMGQNLPPKPDQLLNDSTIAGFDVNNNGIRDDVELAIFEKYPNSAKIRSAMLQYAQALQLELTEVFNSETLVKTIQKEGLAYRCLNRVNSEELDNYEEEIRSLVLNTDIRNRKYSEDLKKYMATYSLLNDEPCDINLVSLPN